MSEPILQLAGISKSFPGVRALADISFDVRPGEVHALLGENGAGKSTLIKIMSGVYQPDEGTVTLDGKATTFSSPQAAQDAGIATIYQELLLFPELSVAENIFMGHAPKNWFGGLDWSAMREKARELLASLDIRDLDVTALVGGLSVGNRQRVEIAKALSHNARVLIMDEPTAALTEHDVERLFGIVRLLRQRGVGVVYISHRLEEVFLLADRVTVLRDGEFVATKPVAEHRPQRPRPDDGGPPHRGALPEGRDEVRRGGAFARQRGPQAGDQRRQPETPRRRDSGDRRAGRLGPQRACGGDFRHDPRRARRHPHRRQARRYRQPLRREASRHRLCPGGSRTPGPGPADAGQPERFARQPVAGVAEQLHRPQGGRRAGARTASRASRSAPAASARSSASFPAATSRRWDCRSGLPPSRASSSWTSRRAASTSAPRPRSTA